MPVFKCFFFVFTFNWLFFSSIAFCLSNTEEDSSKKVINFCRGKTYLQPKKMDGKPPKSLSEGQIIKAEYPYALIAGKLSYIEVHQTNSKSSTIVRIGKSTALEFNSQDSFWLYQGSVLFSHRQDLSWEISSPESHFSVKGSGTWMTEKTEIGFKIILLEGKIVVIGEKNTTEIQAGDLILVTGKKGQTSQKLKIELPLLLATSKLLNNFDNYLPSHSRLVSAAHVQTLRTRKKYESMIGGVTKNRKLEIWQFDQNSVD